MNAPMSKDEYIDNLHRERAVAVARIAKLEAALRDALWYVKRSKHLSELGELKRDKDIAEFSAVLRVSA